MQETWLPVIGYEGFYEISNFGVVKSISREVPHGKGTFKRKIKEKIISQTFCVNGKKWVTLCKNGICTRFLVHQLVARNFIGERPDGMMVCHNDGNGTNNCASNLRYDTHQSNMDDMVKHGKSPRGAKNWNAIATKEQVLKVRELRAQGLYYKDICAQTSLSFESVAKMCQGKSWKWLS